MTSLLFLTIVAALLPVLASLVNAQLTCDVGSTTDHKKVEFKIFSKRNSSGHWITDFTVDNVSPKNQRPLNVNVMHIVDCSGGIQKNRIQGILVAPPPVPQDYVLYAGVGYYKMHPPAEGGFVEAENTCIREGAHLAIVNSDAEFDVIRSLVKEGSAYLGFHDRAKEGEFMTVLGQTMNSTGVNKWLAGEPNNSGPGENCGTYYFSGGFNDVPCDRKYPFICEFELSWG
ncbi:hemolymph lipopolysaccharide-binding protein-like [Ischnura elegans]|uniref:hemolymph lipopolysaccharide-binding protein-like n=1 Tax=Ischnura elegans TaxID=197161 RepID=UPI001ED88E8C|nr:hemolymph lipopolysaccharide-binding protein-like [Ischnura elegans]